MMKMRFPVLLLTTILVAACDNGSTFSGNPTVPPPAGEGLPITSANSAAAMTVALYAAFESGDVGDVAGTLGVGGATVGKVNKVSSSQLRSGILFNAMQKVPFGPIDHACTISGIMTISGTISDPLSLSFSAGDSLTVVATDCIDVPGETVNGQLDYNFVSVTGDILAGPPYATVIDVALTNFSVDDTTDVTVANGNATITLDTLEDPLWLVSIAGPSLMYDTSTSSHTVTNYSHTQTVESADASMPYTMDASGTVQSTDLADYVVYSTPVLFAALGQAYPNTGEFLVSGDNSSIRLIVVDDVNVSLQSDFDGDGVADETIDITWDALLGQVSQ